MFSRNDGWRVENVHPMRRIMPFLLPSRTESFVLCRQEIRTEAMNRFLADRNADRPEDRPITVFHLLLRAFALALEDRPRLNRFLAGGRLYQREGIWLSFSGKKALREDAPIFTVKRRFPEGETLDEMVDGIYDALGVGRSDVETDTDKEVSLLLRLPAPILRRAIAIARRLNEWNLLPGLMTADDPMFASAFVANLGSVNIDACYHHNYEWGTIPVFATLGRVHHAPVVEPDLSLAVAEVVEVKYTYDERVEDGLYCAKALELVRTRLQDPESLDRAGVGG